MNKLTTSTAIPTRALKLEALSSISASFELFCLASGMEALGEMMDHDAQAICGPRHARGHERHAHRWGKTKGKIGFHGGKVEIERPRLRGFDGKEQPVPSWEAAVAENWLGKWAMNQMLINVATRKFARSVRLPEGDIPAPAGAGLSKSAASRRFVALSAARMKDWMASDLSGLDLLVIQIDGIHMDEDLILVAAVGVDAKGDKHPLGLAEGATENAATVQALIDNLVERGLDPTVPRLFIIDGAKALSKAIRRTFGRAAAIQRCQVHKARNIMERLPKSLHASVRRVLRQAWELDDADKAEGCFATSPSVSSELVGGRRLDPGRDRRDPHRHAAWIAEGAAALARLYQHHRECHEHGAARLPEREAMALGLDGDPLDRSRYAGSGQRLPTIEGAQATSSVTCRSASAPKQKPTRRPCSPSQRRLININPGSDRFSMFNKERDIPQNGQCSPLLQHLEHGGEIQLWSSPWWSHFAQIGIRAIA